ncbi:hypothetical protein B0T22DRAFT_478295 [Podospora appendiculata]|uniref:Uncharacterized protein n=1 Tax=Podospora appendiculata TaxID=314037 RepID=A0AAE1CI92_9PEZI|nr:hypothetical protein B0T22DRAFT_478295 [Podospora appendiculata]
MVHGFLHSVLNQRVCIVACFFEWLFALLVYVGSDILGLRATQLISAMSMLSLETWASSFDGATDHGYGTSGYIIAE